MKSKHRGLPGADHRDDRRRLTEIICDTATNSFLQTCSCPEISWTNAKNLGTILDRRVFLMAIATAPLGFACRSRKRPRVHGSARMAMFARRI
jgi:hypothetical protein